MLLSRNSKTLIGVFLLFCGAGVADLAKHNASEESRHQLSTPECLSALSQIVVEQVRDFWRGEYPASSIDSIPAFFVLPTQLRDLFMARGGSQKGWAYLTRVSSKLKEFYGSEPLVLNARMAILKPCDLHVCLPFWGEEAVDFNDTHYVHGSMQDGGLFAALRSVKFQIRTNKPYEPNLIVLGRDGKWPGVITLPYRKHRFLTDPNYFNSLDEETRYVDAIRFADAVFHEAAHHAAQKLMFRWLKSNIERIKKGMQADKLFQKHVQWVPISEFPEPYAKLYLNGNIPQPSRGFELLFSEGWAQYVSARVWAARSTRSQSIALPEREAEVATVLRESYPIPFVEVIGKEASEVSDRMLMSIPVQCFQQMVATISGN